MKNKFFAVSTLVLILISILSLNAAGMFHNRYYRYEETIRDINGINRTMNYEVAILTEYDTGIFQNVQGATFTIPQLWTGWLQDARILSNYRAEVRAGYRNLSDGRSYYGSFKWPVSGGPY